MEKQGSRRRAKAPTISDVAESAGVSVMTVSRVINGETNVRAATREAVEDAIAQLSYSPNRAAQSLASAGQFRVGVLYSNPSAAYLSEFLVGSLDQASRGNIQLVVEKCEPDHHEGEVARRLIAGGMDGLVLPPPLCDSAAVIDVLRETGTPGVAVATGRVAEGISAVGIDDYRAAFEMTAHIVALGHRSIGFITGNPNQTASERRLEGYRAALAEAGIAFDGRLVAQGYFTYRSGLDAAEWLLDLADPPSAIFASNDDMAAATVAIAHRRGLDVPSDLTVCGFDDTALSTTIWPELTTIRQPIADMSRVAIDLLLAEIRRKRTGEDAPARQLVQAFTLVRRQSDAAPHRRPSLRGD